MSAYGVGVLALIAPTVAVLVVTALRTGAELWAGREGRSRLAAVLVLVALAMLLVLAPPTVSDPGTVHLRYVDFLLPIALATASRLTPTLSPHAMRTTTRVAAALWISAAVWLAVRSSHMRPLGVAAPDLFFLYGGREFGTFGLGGFAVPYLLLCVTGGCAAMFSERVRWQHAQAAVLILFSIVSIPNVWRFDTYLSQCMSHDRGVGKLARALAPGRPPSEHRATSYLCTPRSTRPRVSDPAARRRRACVLTTTVPSQGRVDILGHSDAVYLVRLPR